MSVPLNNLTDTWNASGTTFTAIRMNVTDTGHAAASRLLDLQVGGATQFNVDPSGNMCIGGDTFLNRDSSNAFAQRNGTTAQAFRVYNSFTTSLTYERAVFDWTLSTNRFTFGTQASGTGSPRDLYIQAPSANILFDTGSTTIIQTLNGGTAAGSTLTLKATTGVGAGSEYVDILGGNNGAQRLGRFTNTVNGQASGLSIGTTATATNGLQLAAVANNSLKGNIAIDRTTTAATVGTDLSLTAGAAVLAGTDIAGGNIILNAGIGTGASGSNIQMFLSLPSTSGSTDNAVVQQALLNSNGLRIMGSIAIPAGGVTGQGFKFSSTNQFGIFWGSGAPTLSAAQGSLYIRSDGNSTATRLYVNTNGSTGWTNFVSAT